MFNVQFVSEMDPNSDVSLVFFAADRVLGMQTVFADRLFFDIGQLIQKTRTYKMNETLKSVKLPSGQEIEGEFGFIIAKSLKEKLDYGILFNHLEGGGYHITGLWPRNFAEICKSDHEIFEFLMYRLINTPEYFSKVTLYQSSKVKMPKMEVKPPTVEVKPPTITTKPSVSAEISPVSAPSIPSTTAKPFSPPPKVTAAAEVLEGRCPFCKASIPEPRLKVLERGHSTFCPKCLKILTSTSAPSVGESITDVTKRELADLVDEAETNVQNQDYAQAFSNYQKAIEKANLLEDKKYAKELEEKANQCAINLDYAQIQIILQGADELFRQHSYEAAIKEYKIAIDIAKKLGNQEIQKDTNRYIRKCAELIVTEKIEDLIKLGDTQLQEENYEAAKRNFTQALELESRIGEKEAIAHLKQKIRDCEQIPLKKQLKEASLQAEKQFKMNKFEEAAQLYTEAASFASQLDDREAQRFFEQKIEECKTSPIRHQIQEVIANGDDHFQSKTYTDALIAYRYALNLAQKSADKDIIKNIQQKILSCATNELDDKLQGILEKADNSFAESNYADAKKQYQSAIQIAKQMKKFDLVKSLEGKIAECDKETAEIPVEDLLNQE